MRAFLLLQENRNCGDHWKCLNERVPMSHTKIVSMLSGGNK